MTSTLKHLVLVGAGPVHQRVLKHFGAARPVQLRITLLSPTPHPMDWARLPGFVTGADSQTACETQLEPLLQTCGATLETSAVIALDTARRTLTLANGNTLAYDVLSLDTDSLEDRAGLDTHMPGAGQQALLASPAAGFCKLWPQFLALTQQRALRIAVIGEGMRAAELALAVAARLAREAGTQAHRITLVQAPGDADTAWPRSLMGAVAVSLDKAHIVRLLDRCIGVADGEIQLASGMRLACDAPIVVQPPRLPTWLTGSGLPLGGTQQLQTDHTLCCGEQSPVFAHGSNTAWSADQAHPRRLLPSRAAAVLTHNLRARLDDLPLRRVSPGTFQADWISLGHRNAALCVHTPWIEGVWKGSWVWHWKHRRDTSHQKAMAA